MGWSFLLLFAFFLLFFLSKPAVLNANKDVFVAT
jgi:hypothetical protein